ncbi:paraquat-inducible protein A [Pseudoprimorskyibacter insulae]|uniref:Inner membrane protein YebS n=1 Tax=Pseudoprimorskyibacter insulae TaxID=1695997 RepID=A0A2R8B0L5_9RHOB|nr:paraquat-inducible protein A [Pseudoprimorskyibacter insulae]SPF81664.1 Inner membrane protein YebS [Pseudoprimorskyibacter insulae]
MSGDNIACPVCDVMYHLPPELADGETRCARCGYRLTLGQSEAITRVVGLALTSVVLMGMVVFLPFLDLEAGQFSNSATVYDAVMGFSTGIMMPLSLAVMGFIIVLPLLRFGLLIYALAPVVLHRPNAPGANAALRVAIRLKPWAMAEIFMVGVAVALVKLAGMATLHMGPAFWAFVGVVVVAALKDTLMCRNTLWTALANNKA